MPVEARQKYEQAMIRLYANQTGIPDILEGGVLNVVVPPPNAPTVTPAALPSLVQAIGEPQVASRTAILLVASVIVLRLVGAAWYLPSRSWS